MHARTARQKQVEIDRSIKRTSEKFLHFVLEMAFDAKQYERWGKKTYGINSLAGVRVS